MVVVVFVGAFLFVWRERELDSLSNFGRLF